MKQSTLIFIITLLTLGTMGMHAQRRMAARSDFQPRHAAIIGTQPRGTVVQNLNRTSNGFYIESGYAWESVSTGDLGTIVVTDEGDVYLYNPISRLATSTWLKLDKAQGDTLICRLPQDVYSDYYDENEASEYFGIDHDTTVVYQLQRLVYGEDTNGSWYFPDNSGKTDMKFVFNGDTLRMIGEKDVLMGLADGKGEWQGYGEKDMILKRIKEEPLQAPDDAKWETYMLDWVTNSEYDNRTVYVAMHGKDVYFDKLYDGDPEGVVRGTMGDDGIVSIPTHQYLGIDGGYGRHVFFYAGRTYRINDRWGESLDMFGLGDGSDIQLRYNAETREFTAIKDSVSLLINCGDDIVMPYCSYTHPHLDLFIDEPRTPAMPIINLENYSFWDDDWGCAHISFVIPKMDVDGRFIDSEQLYYNIYFDGDLFTLTPDEYEYLTEEMTDIPYSFSDDWDIQTRDGGERIFAFYHDDIIAFGVQSVYKAGGVVSRSEIAWLNSEDVAIKDVETARKLSEAPIYDLQGRRIEIPANGIYIRNGKKLIVR